mmetsp:Transcript_68827/g.165217  ORF Transcript_68827/g.165217 Transcript_68827/m.165217 type:complete len:270 (+) Transcript_68827:307-1116(+)
MEAGNDVAEVRRFTVWDCGGLCHKTSFHEDVVQPSTASHCEASWLSRLITRHLKAHLIRDRVHCRSAWSEITIAANDHGGRSAATILRGLAKLHQLLLAPRCRWWAAQGIHVLAGKNHFTLLPRCLDDRSWVASSCPPLRKWRHALEETFPPEYSNSTLAWGPGLFFITSWSICSLFMTLCAFLHKVPIEATGRSSQKVIQVASKELLKEPYVRVQGGKMLPDHFPAVLLCGHLCRDAWKHAADINHWCKHIPSGDTKCSRAPSLPLWH